MLKFIAAIITKIDRAYTNLVIWLHYKGYM